MKGWGWWKGRQQAAEQSIELVGLQVQVSRLTRELEEAKVGWEQAKVALDAAQAMITAREEQITDIKVCLEAYMSQFGQALEAHGIEFTNTQKFADAAARRVLGGEQGNQKEEGQAG